MSNTTKPVYIWSPFVFEEWDWNKVWSGIGGSEQSHCEMAQRLAKRGHKVISVAPVPASSNAKPDPFGVEWLDARIMALPRTPAVIINYRNPSLFNQPKPEGQEWWYVSEDVDNEGWTAEGLARVDKYLCFCKTHAEYTHFRYPQLKDKIFTTANGVRSEHLNRTDGVLVARDPYRMFYGSSPDRGLLVLLQNWFRIRERFPSATLRVSYGFENIEAIIKNSSPEHPLFELKGELQRYLKQPGIEWLGRLGQEDMYHEWRSASVLPYPSAWSETFCINLCDSMACGCVPVTTNYWAQGEWALAAPLSFVVDGLPSKSPLATSYWLSLLYKALEIGASGVWDQPSETSGKTPREELATWSREHFDWDLAVDQWERWLNEKAETPAPELPVIDSTKQFRVPAVHRDFKGTPEYKDELDILHEIYEAKIYEPLLEHLPAPASNVNFVDLGCHVGHFSRWFTRELTSRGYTYSGTLIDGNEETLEIAKTRLEDLENLKFVHGLVGKSLLDTLGGVGLFRISDYHGMDCIEHPDMEHRDNEQFVQVPFVSPRPASGCPTKVNILKCDIEGAEFDLVENWSRYISIHVDVAIFEVHSKLGDPEKLRRTMAKYDFKHKITATRGLSTMELFWKEKEKESK